MFGVVNSPVHFSRGLFCYSNFFLFILAIKKKEKQIWLPEASVESLTIPKDISIL